MYLPDDLGLRRISLYYRQQPDDLNLFTYLVLVECHGITNGDKMVRIENYKRLRVAELEVDISPLLSGTTPRFRPEDEARKAHRLRVRVRRRKIPNGGLADASVSRGFGPRRNRPFVLSRA